MMLSTEQRSLISRSFLLSPVIINIVVNGLLAWVVYGRTSTIAVSTLIVDALLTCFFIPFLTCIIVVPVIWQLVRQGDLSAVARSGTVAVSKGEVTLTSFDRQHLLVG